MEGARRRELGPFLLTYSCAGQSGTWDGGGGPLLVAARTDVAAPPRAQQGSALCGPDSSLNSLTEGTVGLPLGA